MRAADVTENRLLLITDNEMIFGSYGVLVESPGGPPVDGTSDKVAVFAPWPAVLTGDTAFWVRTVREPAEWLKPTVVTVLRPVGAPDRGSVGIVAFAAAPVSAAHPASGPELQASILDLQGAWLAAERAQAPDAFLLPSLPSGELVVAPGPAEVPPTFVVRRGDLRGVDEVAIRWCKVFGTCNG